MDAFDEHDPQPSDDYLPVHSLFTELETEYEVQRLADDGRGGLEWVSVRATPDPGLAAESVDETREKYNLLPYQVRIIEMVTLCRTLHKIELAARCALAEIKEVQE